MASDDGTASRKTAPRDANHPRKRHRVSSIVDDDQSEIGTIRQSKACSNCRKLKVKCNAADNEGSACSRCARLDLTCLRETKAWTQANADSLSDDFKW